jgi:hypothetical protein
MLLWKLVGPRSTANFLDRVKPDIALMESHRNGFFDELKKRGICTGYFPPSPSFTFSPEIWKDDRMLYKKYVDSPYDFFLVENRWALKFFESITKQKPVIEVGCPKFDTSWMDYLIEKQYKDASIKNMDTASELTILVLLKNESSEVFREVSFEDMLNEILQACTEMTDAKIILKPHLRQDLFLLTKIMNRYQGKSITISNEPSYVLFKKVQIIISMPSGIILDALISGQPVIEYFNYEKLNKTLMKKYKKIPKGAFGGLSYLDKEGHLKSIFRGKKLVLTADRQDELESLIRQLANEKVSNQGSNIRSLFPDNASEKVAKALFGVRGCQDTINP